MKWKSKNGIVEDDDGAIVCVLSENATAHHIALIKNASDMFVAIMDYLQSVESTSHPRNPKKHYNNFQKIIERITDET